MLNKDHVCMRVSSASKSLIMFPYLVSWVFEILLGVSILFEEHIIDPCTKQCQVWAQRYRYGTKVVRLPQYDKDWNYIIDNHHQTLEVQPLSQVRYVGINGEVYVLIQEDYCEPADFYVYDAIWTTNGITHVDVTHLLRQIAGPCGDSHGQELTLQDIVRYLAFNDPRCRGPYTSASQLQWTCGKTLTQHCCNEWTEVMDFCGAMNNNDSEIFKKNVVV